MWRVYYDTTTGAMKSEGTGGFPAQPPGGWDFREYTDRPSIDTLMWDGVTRDFIARPPKVLVDRLLDIITNSNYAADFLVVWNALNATRKNQLRNAMIRLLGNQRWRAPSETVEIP